MHRPAADDMTMTEAVTLARPNPNHVEFVMSHALPLAAGEATAAHQWLLGTLVEHAKFHGWAGAEICRYGCRGGWVTIGLRPAGAGWPDLDALREFRRALRAAEEAERAEENNQRQQQELFS